MDIPVAAGPWFVLGVVLGALLPVLAALGVLAVRHGSSGSGTPTPEPPSDVVEDDLPAFLESPPGSRPSASSRGDTPVTGWAPLSSPPVHRPEPAAPARRSGTAGALAAMAATSLLLIGAAAFVATRATDAVEPASDPGSGARGEDRTTATPGPGTVTARLTFGGVVLERHAVGVTAAYPRVRATAAGDRATAEVELATFNCLRAEAPEDPAAAGCVRSVTEYAHLSAPDLTVDAEGAGLRLTGRFPTERRPNGSPPERTGRVYELTIRAFPRDGRAGTGQEPAGGLFGVGDDEARTVGEGPNDITYGG